jgi:hypothetical protein
MDAGVADHREAVTIETPPPRLEARHKIEDGVHERTTCQLVVKYWMSLPPVFDLAITRWTSIAREFGYVVVGGLEKLRSKLPRRSEAAVVAEPGLTRRILRRVRSSLVVRFLLPAYRVQGDLEPPPDGLYEFPPLGFEASRRVFEFESNGKRVSLLVCHVLAECRGDAADRLLNQFALIAGRGPGVVPGLTDQASGLCLQGRPTGRLRTRQYWEIVIGATERFVSARSTLEGSADPIARQFGQDGLTLGSMGDHDILSNLRSPHVEMPDAAFVREVLKQSEVDLDFVMAEVRAALEHGDEIDDGFIRELAVRRFEYARSDSQAQGSGPTLESSFAVVRDIVALHPDVVTEGGEWESGTSGPR